MPNIIEISPSCPSSCALIGSASIMRDFLLAKNLPDVPSDIITAGLSSEWYNDGSVATEYNNFDPGSLVNPGDVLNWGDSNIDQMRIQHKNLNLYDDYDPDHYYYGGYTEYPLVSIDDINVGLNDFGDIREWTDPDEALVVADTWDHKWLFELHVNKYYPGPTSYYETSLPAHSDYVVVDVENPSITFNPYTIQHFISNYNQTPYNNINFYFTFLDPWNAYHPVNNGGYNGIQVGATMLNYAYTSFETNLVVNSTNDDINDFTTPDGVQTPWDYVTTAAGARDYFETKNKYYNDANHVYQNILTPASTQYTNESTNDQPVGDSDIDVFDVDTTETPGIGIIEGSTFTPSGMVEYYCNYLNIYGGDGSLSNTRDFDVWLDFIKNDTLAGCSPYIKGVLSPEEYGIQSFTNLQDVNLNLLAEYLPPQTSIVLYEDGSTLDLINFGITTDINTAIGNVLTTNPVPFEAILSVLDKKLDTPLGKYAKRKLASELFNRINLNLRQDAYGVAEQVAAGIEDTIFGIFSKDKKGSDGIQEIINAFKNFEITVPKTLIGRAANFISSISGTNIKLDPIKEPISWTDNVEKTEPVDDEIDSIYDLNNKTTSFWASIFNNKTSDDPSSILIDYTSNGQRGLIAQSLMLNEYTPYYEKLGIVLKSGDSVDKLERKKKRLERQKKRIKEKIAYQDKVIEKLETDIGNLSVGTVPDDYKKSIERKANSCAQEKNSPGFTNCYDQAVSNLTTRLNGSLSHAKNQQKALVDKFDEKQKAIDLIETNNPLPFYPTHDDGTFNSTDNNSELENQYQLSDKGLFQRSPLMENKDYNKSFNVSSVNSSGNFDKSVIYEFPIDDTDTNKSRYEKNRWDGLAPEEPVTEDNINFTLYYQVKDLVKHGTHPDDSTDVRSKFSGGRGLNYKTDSKIGYNVYPLEVGKMSAGLGRVDQYNNQSLFSVLEDNGYVKISPLWSTDKYQSAKDAKEFVESYNPYSDYKDMVTLHRYMFSIENLAWKGYGQNLPWQERGPNGGRILWFPPYDLKVSDTSSVTWGQENLIGRNEPIYTYNHTERTGVLSFKLLIDYAGYYQECNETSTSILDFASLAGASSTVPEGGPQSTTDIIPPTNTGSGTLDVTKDTYIFIILDGSVSMDQYNTQITDLFGVTGSNGKIKTLLTDTKTGVYTEDQYNNQVFIFKDPGHNVVWDNIDDGRFFAYFAMPYFKTINQDSNLNTISYRSYYGSPTYINYTVQPLTSRLASNIITNNLSAFNSLPSSALTDVICIVLTNDSHPAYGEVYPWDGTGTPAAVNPIRLQTDIADYLTAKSHYTKFKGIVLGYDWGTPNTKEEMENQSINQTIISYASSDGSAKFNNMNITTPATGWDGKVTLTPYGDLIKTKFVASTSTGNYDTITPQSIPAGGTPLADIFYCLEIGKSDGISGIDTGLDNDINIVNVITQALTKDNVIIDQTTANITEETLYPDQIDKLIGWFKELTFDNPKYNSQSTECGGLPSDIGPKLSYDSSGTNVLNSELETVIPPSSTYDIPLLDWLKTGINSNSVSTDPMVIRFDEEEMCAAKIYTPLEFLQHVVGNTTDVTSEGKITAKGWNSLLKYFRPADADVSSQYIGCASTDPNDPENTNVIYPNTTGSPTPNDPMGSFNGTNTTNAFGAFGGTNPPQIPTNTNSQIFTPQSTPLSTITNTPSEQWGVDVNTSCNPLNEFLYFKRMEQTDPIFFDTIKEKIQYFDPAFHSITPVGFNNRLNFLEQCARQGPSINNSQDLSGNFISANSNLAFGRPPISILRIGDFYHTRIAVETVDISYEPFLWDMNPEGIGVQPMICDVTINFKYLGGSSLSGPITQLQNAISNNYFANVEFYNTQALKAFDRYKTKAGGTSTISDIETSTLLSSNATSQNLSFVGTPGTEVPIPATNPQSQQSIITYNKPTSTTLNNNKADDKTNVTNKCPICPTGYVLVGLSDEDVGGDRDETFYNGYGCVYEGELILTDDHVSTIFDLYVYPKCSGSPEITGTDKFYADQRLQKYTLFWPDQAPDDKLAWFQQKCVAAGCTSTNNLA